MIIIRSLVKETLKSQISILFILILIFFSQKTINILSSAVQGNIPSDLIFVLLGYGIPQMAQLILPLSLFFGLLMTYSKLYINSEITVMHACGFGKKILVISALILVLFTTFIATLNVALLLPLSEKYQEQALANAKANPSLANIVEGQFKTSKNQNFVLYINEVNSKKFNDIFIAKLRKDNHQYPSVIIAKSGHIHEDIDGNQIIILDKGIHYEGRALLNNFRITNFKDYQSIIDHKETTVISNKIEQKNMFQLWHSTDIASKIEFHWRLTLVLSVLIMALIAVPLSKVNPRQGRVLSILPAMLLYLFFFLLQSTLHSNAKKGVIDPIITIWLVNVAFLLLSIILNIWDIIFIRKLRFLLYRILS
ncbi:Lipopolysaccharide export system permease protein LptF [Candidatus Arsenophonus lipoptenae]|uniref:Lipopolysaccharide export system permease protein LptF n=1 Tax=Candidatus Arsenophonus lipoptenae TaxID=634113 RepID=A0A120HPY6_9GAMM|nr:LPS export ABC transporter permease LptF [Candidatus Arsenophonus lipoptenae]AMA65189.1 Lipopolysaccharide export system permease protein LptF [Candidatus Arsenophonus lipoptenae]